MEIQQKITKTTSLLFRAYFQVKGNKYKQQNMNAKQQIVIHATVLPNTGDVTGYLGACLDCVDRKSLSERVKGRELSDKE